MGRGTIRTTITNLGSIRGNESTERGIGKLPCKKGGSTSRGPSRSTIESACGNKTSVGPIEPNTS